MKKKQEGIAHIIVLVVVILVVLVALLSYVVFKPGTNNSLSTSFSNIMEKEGVSTPSPIEEQIPLETELDAIQLEDPANDFTVIDADLSQL